MDIHDEIVDKLKEELEKLVKETNFYYKSRIKEIFEAQDNYIKALENRNDIRRLLGELSPKSQS